MAGDYGLSAPLRDPSSATATPAIPQNCGRSPDPLQASDPKKGWLVGTHHSENVLPCTCTLTLGTVAGDVSDTE